MERGARAIAAFVVDGTLAPGARVQLDDDAAHHARVRRVVPGETVRLLDGRGRVARARLESLSHGRAEALVEHVDLAQALPELRLYVPVADRERMLWLAEKSVELGITSWHPVMFSRSRSVASRGEGASFDRKLQARVRSALEQSGSAWLPRIHPVVELPAAAADDAPVRMLLDASGETPTGGTRSPAAAIIGPEGGMEAAEQALLRDAGWRPMRIPGHTLRFETAGVAAVALLRFWLQQGESP